MRYILLALTIFFAAPATAQVASGCDWRARADAIVEPWEDNTATFANGAVRVALLDVAEPAAAAYYLLILHPPVDSVAGRTCTVIGLSENLGYSAIFFNELEALYDAAVGLTFLIPAISHLPEEDFHYSVLLSIGVNQASGEVTVTQAVTSE